MLMEVPKPNKPVIDQTDCPECESTRTFATPETIFERFCADCGFVWDIAEEVED